MARRSSTRRFSSPARRKFVWARTNILNSQVPAGSTSPSALSLQFNLLSGFEAAYGAQLIGATVVRIRGLATMEPEATVTPQAMRMGVKVGTASEEPIGGPFLQPHADWMLIENFGFRPALPTGQVLGLQRVIDNKASRKIEEVDEELQVWFEASTTSGSWLVTVDLSIGVKLP